MKKLLLICALGLAGQCLLAQSVIDVPPRGRENERAVEGGAQCVEIDTNTPLPELLRRLEGDWREVETGKAYWIGYTTDMYSIAARGDMAINSILDFINKTKSDHARYGAILTLHLIGIERKITGRYVENFRNQKARDALLSLLSKKDLQVRVLTLLIRDPWPSDVPHLFEILQGETLNEWAFVKALQRYKLPKRPIHQELPKELSTLPCGCNYKSKTEYHRKFIQALLKSAGDKVIVENNLLDLNLWGDIQYAEGFVIGGFGNVLEQLTGCDYTGLKSKIEYYTKDKKVYICSISTASGRWLEWWQKESENYKKSLQKTTKTPSSPNK